MEKKIRSELLKMYAMMLVLAGLGIYAHEFVIAGIMAKVALNSTIFATFGLAAWLAFRHVIKLRNEVVALKALQVDYGQRSRRPLDPYRHPAIVFHEPELLGQGYRMITEELGKQGDLHISNATVQTLLHDVDQRINDRKSTIIYFSGLMVFLGLLGAFMGLMKTVHSVSDLIGGMDVSGNASADSFGKMIDGMKAPLNGMSVGFSSSLFGLMTSMVLGALERCMTSAMKTLRNEFEHWLSNVAALESSEGGSAVTIDTTNVVRAIELGGKHLRDLRETVLDTGMAQMDTQKALTIMADAVAELARSVEKVTDPEPLLKPISDVVAELARNQTMMVGQFHGLINMAERDRTTIREMLDRMNGSIERQAGLDGPQLHSQLERIADLQGALLEQEPVVVNMPQSVTVASARPGLLSRLAGWLPGVSGGGSLEHASERRRLKRDVAKMMASQRKLFRKLERSFGTSVGKLESGRRRDQDMVAQLMSRNELNQARLTALMDRLQMLDEAQSVSGDGAHLLGGLHGARLEMDVLRRRLDLMQEAENEAISGTQTSSVNSDRSATLPATGTDRG